VNLNQYFIFDELGATEHDVRAPPDPRLKVCWALCDSNSDVIRPCAFHSVYRRPDRAVLTPHTGEVERDAKTAEQPDAHRGSPDSNGNRCSNVS
jgi:hypothetical protein